MYIKNIVKIFFLKKIFNNNVIKLTNLDDKKVNSLTFINDEFDSDHVNANSISILHQKRKLPLLIEVYSTMRFIVIAFKLLMTIGVVRCDYYYDNANIDQCLDIYDTDEVGECHNRYFTGQTIQQTFGQNARTCCATHAYRFYDRCQDHSSTYSIFACRSPGGDPVPPQISISCPGHCKSHYISREDFFIQNDILLLNTTSRDITVSDYCLYYECDDDKWVLRAEACICINETKVNELDISIPKNVKRCCPPINFYTIQQSRGNVNQEINCLFNPNTGLISKSCSLDFMIIQFEAPELNVSNSEIVFREHQYSTEPPNRIPISSSNYCAGVGFNSLFSVEEPLKKHLVYCKPPCKGQSPCLRTCCSPNDIFTSDGECKYKPDSQKVIQDNVINNSNNNNDNTSSVHLDKMQSSERRCPKGYERKPYLEPNVRCNDRFEIFVESPEQISLRIPYSGTIFESSEFCVAVNEKSDLIAEICRKIQNHDKFGFYPYILISSTVFLAITLVVYTVFNRLQNVYTLLMRHFAGNMMLAFILLAINQLVTFGNISLSLCKLNGFLQQYFFLTMFAFMTGMSLEIRSQIMGLPSSDTKYIRTVIYSYLIPLVIIILTLIVEYTAPECASFRPRFGEISCLFTDKTSKAIWLFLPISMMLAINFWIFVSCVRTVWVIDQQAVNVGSETQQRDKIDRFLTYIKLFVGMGFIWIFEIIAGMASDDIHESAWYFFDVLNMMQGFFVFVTFVCKRNVINAILCKQAIDESSKENDVAMLSLRDTEIQEH